MAMTDAQRRLKNREKTARYRARQREASSKAKPVTSNAGDGDAATTMRDAVARALGAMKWLVEADAGSIEQARMLAEDVDLLRHAGDMVKTLSAQRALSRVLNDLGGTPTVRMQHELRSLRAQGKDPDDSDSDSEPEVAAGGNVSQFKRPPKRRAAR